MSLIDGLSVVAIWPHAIAIDRANPNHTTCNKNLQQCHAYGHILAFFRISASIITYCIIISNHFATVNGNCTIRVEEPGGMPNQRIYIKDIYTVKNTRRIEAMTRIS